MDEKSEPKVDIAENGMSATLILPKDFDRATLTPDVCELLLKQANVHTDAIDPTAVQACITKAQDAKPGRFEGVIAQANPAIHGVDAYIEWQLEDLQASKQDNEEEKTSAKGETQADEPPADETVSFYDQSIYTVVNVGDVLGKVHPEVPGTEGKDVRGKTLATRTAKPLEFKYDETLEIDEQNRLVAKADGVLIRDRKSALISDTIEVDQNVDFETGNIDFRGNILVHRGVKDCFIVKATEDVEVRGLIEAATIITGKDLRANGGFAGREQGTAEVQGNLFAKYLDAVTIHVAGDLCVERENINSNNTVLGNINSPRGSIIGGVTNVSGTVELLDLGASAQPITEIHVGVLPLLDPLIDDLSVFTEELIQERDRLLNEHEMITANSGSRIAPTHQAKLDEINMAMGKIQLQLDRAEPSLERVRERAEAIRKIDVKINRKLHPNALLVCGGYHYRITNEIKGPIRITANKRGQLEYQQGESKPQLLSTESELRTAA